MKKVLFALLCAVVVLACEKKPTPPPPPVYGDAALTEFGFYLSDNPVQLLEDVVATISGNAINVQVPSDTDLSALVAKFKTTANDTVSVAGVQQVTGVTPNDFSKPVDYLITEGTSNALFTVKVENLPAASWTKVTEFITEKDEIDDFQMAINPKTGLPELLYALDTGWGEEMDDFLRIFKLEGNSLVSSVVLDAEADNYNLTFDADGNAYVCYQDDESDKYCVLKRSGSAWNAIGTDIAERSNSYGPGFVTLPNGGLMLLTSNFTNGIVGKRELNITTYDGSTWTTGGTIPGVTGYRYWPTAVTKGDITYVALQYPLSPKSISLYKYEAGTWTVLEENFNQPKADGSPSGNYTYGFGMEVDDKGNVFLSYSNDVEISTGKPRVFKYSAETEKISMIATPIDEVSEGIPARYTSVAVNQLGLPFLMYINNTKIPQVVGLDRKSQQWGPVTPVGSDETTDFVIKFNKDGVGYAASLSSIEVGEEDRSKIVIYKYE